MPEFVRQFLISFLRVPLEPSPPEGADLRTFKAAPNYYWYSILTVIAGTATTLFFITIGAVFAFKDSKPGSLDIEIGILLVVLVTSLLGSLFQLLTRRLDYELRWYMVTDSGLRIREGVTKIHEITMAFKNIQNVTITQGPLQRLFGLSDLVVQTAGGSSAVQQQGQQGVVTSHVGYFRGVDNAEEIRELIMNRLRKVKGSGLGQSPAEETPEPESASISEPSLDALRLVAQEARLLRGALAETKSSR